ncbi:MAG: hypothetical protein OXH59_03080 [Rhodospirillaceae bacterium]|nr:hypothetical protein [Rhodospirillaceae bacterium]
MADSDQQPKSGDTQPQEILSGQSAWIMQALNGITGRLDGIEGRLRKIEIRLYITFGILIGIGFVVGLVSRIVSFDFAISIVPK